MSKTPPSSEQSQSKGIKSRYTHDGMGRPLASFILNGSVAYVPMIPKPPAKFKGALFKA